MLSVDKSISCLFFEKTTQNKNENKKLKQEKLKLVGITSIYSRGNETVCARRWCDKIFKLATNVQKTLLFHVKCSQAHRIVAFFLCKLT